MNWIRRILLMGVFAALPAAAVAADAAFRPFTAETPAQLRATRDGRPYILVFWSVTCPGCVEELPHWVRRQRAEPQVAIHLVNLDPPAEQAAALALLKRRRAMALERWALADAVPERVHWAVDPAWHGETPHVRFHDRAGQVTAVTGRIDPALLARWFASTRR